MIQLIATDMDGTFLDSNKSFSPEFLDIFFQLKQRKIKFVIASGNQYYRLYQKFLPMSESMYFIAENGSYIAKGSKELYSNVMGETDLQEAINLLLKYEDIFIVLCGRKGAYILNKNIDQEEVVKKYYCNYQFVDSFDKIEDGIMKIAVYHALGNIETFFSSIHDKLPKKLKVVTSGNCWMDIQNKDINKGIAIRFLQMIYEIPPENCMAFGDQMNDYEMLQQVTYSYAMENAVEPIKNIAYRITRSNEEQGVLETIKEIVLNGENKEC